MLSRGLKIFFIVLSSLLLINCVNTQNYTNTINTWQGAHIDEIFHTWGYPERIEKLPNGHKILIYSQMKHGTQKIRCQTRFEINKSGRVLGVTFKGNHCVTTNEFIYRSAQGNTSLHV